jgi:hypothetical protein
MWRKPRTPKAENGIRSSSRLAGGEDVTAIYRFEPGPYVGRPGRQRPTTVRIEVTQNAKATAAAKARSCPDSFEVFRTGAERS